MSLTRIPGAQVPVLEGNGLMSREWYRFFYNLFQLTGGGSTDVTPAEMQAEIDALQVQVGVLNGQIALVNDEIVALSGTVSTLNGQVITINTHIDVIDAEIVSINNQIVVINGQILTLQNGLTYLMEAAPVIPVDTGAIVQQSQLSYLSTIVDGLAATVNELGSIPHIPSESLLCYGSFYDTTSQTAAAINTAYAMTFDSDGQTAYGVYRGSPTSRIYVTTPGTYNFQFSAQFDCTSGGTNLAFIWCRVNGTDIANSASEVRLKGNDSELVASWNFFLTLAAGDYFELMWATDDTGIQITAQTASAPVPAIPSVILTVNQISSPSGH